VLTAREAIPDAHPLTRESRMPDDPLFHGLTAIGDGFILEFGGTTAWVHLDITGPALLRKGLAFAP